MKEEVIISGRMNLNVDPVLHMWHWQIPIYLFLGGLAAGLLFFAAYFTITGKQKKFSTAVNIGPIIAIVAIGLGLVALLLDLKHPLYFWQLYTTIRLESPMSWGAWTLMLIMPLAILWVLSMLKYAFPEIKCKFKISEKFIGLFVKPTTEGIAKWDYKLKILRKLEKLLLKNKLILAWSLLILAIILGVYTGILLSAFNARPLWNTTILGPLFLTSGLSTAAALLMWMSKNKDAKHSFGRIDIALIIIELFFITHMFMGFLAGAEVQIQAAELFLGGDFTVTFWINVMILGLAIPLILEVLEAFKIKIPVAIPAILILWGGLMFRFIMTDAGQVTRFLY